MILRMVQTPDIVNFSIVGTKGKSTKITTARIRRQGDESVPEFRRRVAGGVILARKEVRNALDRSTV